MDLLAVVLKSKRYVNRFVWAFLAVSSGLVKAGDSTIIVTPTVQTNIMVPNSSCSRNDEVALSNSGRLLKCQGNVWRYQGIANITRSFTTVKIISSEIGRSKSMVANCPVGKRVVGGGCAFLSGNQFDEQQNLLQSFATSNTSGYQCTFGPLTSDAIKPFVNTSGVSSPASMSVEAYCAEY